MVVLGDVLDLGVRVPSLEIYVAWSSIGVSWVLHR